MGPPFTLQQQRILAIVPHVTGSISCLFSAYVIFTILNDKKRRSRIYHRLLLGISICELSTAFWTGLSTFPIPDGTKGVWRAVGNIRSCTVQGFWLQFGVASAFYNASLSFYYLFVIRYGWKESQLIPYERWLFHTIPLLWSIATSVYGLIAGIYGSANLWCWVPPKYIEFRYIAFYGPLWLMILVVTLNVFLVYIHVRKTDKAAQKHRLFQNNIGKFHSLNNNNANSYYGFVKNDSDSMSGSSNRSSFRRPFPFITMSSWNPLKGSISMNGTSSSNSINLRISMLCNDDPTDSNTTTDVIHSDNIHHHEILKYKSSDCLNDDDHNDMITDENNNISNNNMNRNDNNGKINYTIYNIDNNNDTDIENDINDSDNDNDNNNGSDNDNDNKNINKNNENEKDCNNNNNENESDNSSSNHKICNEYDTNNNNNDYDDDKRNNSNDINNSDHNNTNTNNHNIDSQIKTKCVHSDDTIMENNNNEKCSTRETSYSQIVQQRLSEICVPAAEAIKTTTPTTITTTAKVKFCKQTLDYHQQQQQYQQQQQQQYPVSRHQVMKLRKCMLKKTERTKEVSNQCLLYAGGFYFTWLAITATRIIQQVNNRVYFPLLVLAVICVPCQGFANFLVYIAPRVRSLQKQRKKQMKRRNGPDYLNDNNNRHTNNGYLHFIWNVIFYEKGKYQKSEKIGKKFLTNIQNSSGNDIDMKEQHQTETSTSIPDSASQAHLSFSKSNFDLSNATTVNSNAGSTKLSSTTKPILEFVNQLNDNNENDLNNNDDDDDDDDDDAEEDRPLDAEVWHELEAFLELVSDNS